MNFRIETKNFDNTFYKCITNYDDEGNQTIKIETLIEVILKCLNNTRTRTEEEVEAISKLWGKVNNSNNATIYTTEELQLIKKAMINQPACIKYQLNNIIK